MDAAEAGGPACYAGCPGSSGAQRQLQEGGSALLRRKADTQMG